MEHTYIVLQFRQDGIGKDEEIKFSDLEEFLECPRWHTLRELTVTGIPTSRGEDFEDEVTRFIFNVQHIWSLSRENGLLKTKIYGE